MQAHSAFRDALTPLVPVAIWYRDGFRLAIRAPFRILVASFLPLAVEIVLQLIPWLGVPLSKLVTPMVALGGIAALRRLDNQGEWRWSDLASAFSAVHRARAFRWSLLLSLIWLFQCAVAMVLHGSEGLRALLLGVRIPELMTPAFALLVIILPGMLLTAPLTLSGPLVILEGRPALLGVRESLRWAGRFWPSVLAYAGTSTLVFCAGMLLSPLLLLPGIPLLLTSGYCAYRCTATRPSPVAAGAWAPIAG